MWHGLLVVSRHPWVAAVNTKIASKDVDTTKSPCHKLSIPIKSSSLLKINTNGSIPVRLYQKACIPVLVNSARDIAAAT